MKLLTTFFLLLTLSLLSLVLPNVAQAAFNPNPVYIQACGGTTTSTASCSKGCDPIKGVCKATAGTVIKYSCDGKTNECKQNPSGFATQQVVTSVCNKTETIEIYSKNCGSSSNWSCTSADKIDSMTRYSGDCASADKPVQLPSNNLTGMKCSDIKIAGLSPYQWNTSPQTWSGALTVSGFGCTTANGSNPGPWRLAAFDIFGNKIAQSPQNGQNLSPALATVPTAGFGYTLSCVEVYGNGNENSTGRQCGGIHIQSQQSVAAANTTQTGATPTPTPSPTPTPTPSPSPTPTPSPTPSPTPTPSTKHSSSCESLTIVSGDNSLVPAKVTLRARGQDNQGSIQRYRYYFGDGEQTETDQAEIQHTYTASGTFRARVDVKDSKGNWQTSSSCEKNVVVRGSSIESHKSNCSDVQFTYSNGGQAPSTVTFTVSGYDNKGSLQGYKLDFGTGVSKESTASSFEAVYEKPGTFTVRGYIKDSKGNWIGGTDSCKDTLYIHTKPLQTQPTTGASTTASILGIGSGGAALLSAFLKRKLAA